MIRRWFRPARFSDEIEDLLGVGWKELRPVPYRLSCAWAVLRGRPVGYRLHINGGIDFPPGTRGARIVECVIDGGGKADYGIRIDHVGPGLPTKLVEGYDY